MFTYNKTNIPDNVNLDNKILNKIFKEINNLVKKEQKWIINIVFTDNEYIKDLNKKFRNKDKATDVLSFHYYEDFSDLKEEDLAWEIIISHEIIYDQAKENNLTVEQESYVLIIHSILHILWYDHEKESEYLVMKKLEDKVWGKIKD